MSDQPKPMSIAFHTLHAIVHERDFLVRVNDATINFAWRSLEAALIEEGAIIPKQSLRTCPACACGFDPLTRQPNKEDR